MHIVLKTVIVAGMAFASMAPAYAEPVENGTEIAQLLEALGDRCWAVDLDGAVLDAAALSGVEGPIDIELECVIAAVATPTMPLPNSVL